MKKFFSILVMAMVSFTTVNANTASNSSANATAITAISNHSIEENNTSASSIFYYENSGKYELIARSDNEYENKVISISLGKDVVESIETLNKMMDMFTASTPNSKVVISGKTFTTDANGFHTTLNNCSGTYHITVKDIQKFQVRLLTK